MTIDKAIEILQDYHDRLPRGVNDDYIDANQLGIEALKQVQFIRGLPTYYYCAKLPGETKE